MVLDDQSGIKKTWSHAVTSCTFSLALPEPAFVKAESFLRHQLRDAWRQSSSQKWVSGTRNDVTKMGGRPLHYNAVVGQARECADQDKASFTFLSDAFCAFCFFAAHACGAPAGVERDPLCPCAIKTRVSSGLRGL